MTVLSEKATLKTIFTYFTVALIILLNAYLLSTQVAMFLSILLLIPLSIWHRSYSKNEKLSKEIDGNDKNTVLSWIFTLFILALSVRVPSVLLFGSPYEKTPLIYLLVLTIVIVEKIDISSFGFKTQNIGKALLYGLTFYAILGGVAMLILYSFVYYFTNQMPTQYYDASSFLFAMPFMTLCVGISEEGFFRGYVQTHLGKFYTVKKAILIQAMLFGVWHFVWNLFPFDPWGMIQYMTTTFIVGLVFGYFYNKAKNLAPLVFAHGLWNSIPQGIVTNEAAFTALQATPLSNQILTWFIPYTISAALTFLFIKLFAREI